MTLLIAVIWWLRSSERPAFLLAFLYLLCYRRLQSPLGLISFIFSLVSSFLSFWLLFMPTFSQLVFFSEKFSICFCFCGFYIHLDSVPIQLEPAKMKKSLYKLILQCAMLTLLYAANFCCKTWIMGSWFRLVFLQKWHKFTNNRSFARNEIRYSYVQKWKDYNLAWNESDYGGIKSVRIPPVLLWKPDILMYNRSAVTTSNK